MTEDFALDLPAESIDDREPAAERLRPVLVVDDVPANLLAMQVALAPLGREIVTASSGTEALRLLLDREFCLVLLDLRMPGMDGYETAALIRERARTRELPIIFVTAHDRDDEAVLRGYRLGAVDFLHKPLHDDVLRAKAGVFIALHDQAEALAAERAKRVAGELRRHFEAEALKQQVTQEQAKQAQLDRLNQILAENERRRNAFLAILGHELRNPLAPIRTAVELARNGALTPRLLDVIDRQSATLARLLDDLIDVTRINANRFELRTTRQDLREVVSDAVDACVVSSIEKAGHALDVSVPAHPVMVMTDHVRLVQVLTNLIDNACRYTPSDGQGRIEVSCGADDHTALVRVRDNGVGIRPELLDSIFEMFSPNRMRTDGSGGLGLGLALSRRIVEMHGGTMRATSDGEGKGACFEFALPLAHDTRDLESRNTKNVRSRRTLRAVVVDDNEDARELLAEILRVNGHSVTTAKNGLTGLALIKEHGPDVALIDLALPDLDGVSLVKRLRAEAPGLATRLVAITGFGDDGDKARTHDAGFHAHLVKPVDVEALLGALDAPTAAD
jgi:signal transduction histidine kinase